MYVFPVNWKQMDSKINLDSLCSDNDFMPNIAYSLEDTYSKIYLKYRNIMIDITMKWLIFGFTCTLKWAHIIKS